MPQGRFSGVLPPTSPSAPSGGRFSGILTSDTAPYESETTPDVPETSNFWGNVAGAGALAAGVGGAALAAKKGKLGPAWEMTKKVGRYADAGRKQLMLSGYALPKSILGAVGGAATTSIERGSMRPLKEMFSMETVRDIGKAWKADASHPEAGATLSLFGKKLPTPGRFMGVLDEAAKGAFQRAGFTAEEAATEMLQAPMTGDWAKALDSPIMRYAVPFRRTPTNQFIQGGMRFNPETYQTYRKGKLTALGVTSAAGAAEGVRTADDRYPASVGIGAAAAAKYGLPFLGSAYLGRVMAGGSLDAGIMAQALPISEYGLSSGLVDPLAPVMDPALARVLRKWAGETP